ncbi:hypothetical protein LSM04_004036 [Trypanosoma melophagium]|uniref:uncharacterized protein n=1 Tax=Trypanosoma melophagium TaxID=715481 RepID=UPI00351A73AB|nr:hypothetical protein LSM04_004036 [Trypanosoma melophagium]
MSEQTDQSLIFDSESSGPCPPASAATTTAAAATRTHSRNNNSNSNSHLNVTNHGNSLTSLSNPPVYNNHNKNNSIATASVTADLSSSKLPVTSSASAAALPLSSLSFGRGTSVLQCSRRKGGPMTLYVRTDSSEDTDVSPVATEARDGGASGAAEVNEETPAEDEESEGLSSLIWSLCEMGADALHKLRNIIPDMLRHPQEIRFATEILVFAFFCITFIFLLGVAQERIEWMAKISAYDIEQSILVSTSLTEELLRKSNEVNELMMPVKRTSPDALEKASMVIKDLSDSRELSVKLLHSRLHYPGPVEDIKFLLEEHVAYKINLARLVREELEWLDRTKQSRMENRESPIGSTVTLKPKQKSSWNQKWHKQHKQQDNGQELKRQQQEQQQGKYTEQQSKPEVILRPARGGGGGATLTRLAINETGLVDFLISSLKNRLVALLIVFLLVVLYKRMS